MAFLTSIRRGAAFRSARWFLALALLSAAGTRAAVPSAEYQLKAIFLFNFAQFVEWPSRAVAGELAPFVIGVLGDDPFGAYLDETVRGERIANHPIVVRRYRRAEEVTGCHVLFISRSEIAQMGQIVAGFKGQSILTVGDVDDFNRLGGIVRFVTEQGKIRLRIDVQAAQSAGLKISSKLLRSAMIVTQEHE